MEGPIGDELMPTQDDVNPLPARNAGGRWFRPFRANRLWPLGLGLLGSLVGVLIFTTFDRAPSFVGQDEIGPAVAKAMASATPAPAVAAEVYKAIFPSLVYIRTEASDGGRGLGSGVIVNRDGSILTAYHVVAGASTINVTFADGTRASAQVVSAEPERDLAVLLADGSPEIIVPAVLAGSLHIGDLSFAVGNPLGLVASISAGVISGLDRSIPLEKSDQVLEGLIQFDAGVNPGSSGGPLLNRRGQVVGIVTALANPSNDSSFTGIGFAIPIGAAGGAGGGPPQ